MDVKNDWVNVKKVKKKDHIIEIRKQINQLPYLLVKTEI